MFVDLKLIHARGERDRLPCWRSRGQPGITREVNLRNPFHIDKKAHKGGIHPVFETQGRHRQKCKIGVSKHLENKCCGENF